MSYTEVIEKSAEVFEGIGVAIITLGGAYALVRAVIERAEGRSIFSDARKRFGRPLLLGLEILVAADIIETVTVDRTLEGVLGLGILVLIRVVLSFSLEIELDGVLPWRKAQFEREESAARGAADD